MNYANLQTYTALTIVAGLVFSGCEVKKTEEGELPKVNVEGGKLPKFDVKPADVNIEMKKKEITVPEVTVTTPKEKREGEAAATNERPASEAPQSAPAQ